MIEIFSNLTKAINLYIQEKKKKRTNPKHTKYKENYRKSSYNQIATM